MKILRNILFIIFLAVLLTSQSASMSVQVIPSGNVTYRDEFGQFRRMETGEYTLDTFVRVGESPKNSLDDGKYGAILVMGGSEKLFVTCETDSHGIRPNRACFYQIEGTLYDFIDSFKKQTK